MAVRGADSGDLPTRAGLCDALGVAQFGNGDEGAAPIGDEDDFIGPIIALPFGSCELEGICRSRVVARIRQFAAGEQRHDSGRRSDEARQSRQRFHPVDASQGGRVIACCQIGNQIGNGAGRERGLIMLCCDRNTRSQRCGKDQNDPQRTAGQIERNRHARA